MLFSQSTFSFAENNMEDVLISVKERVEIPKTLTEFDTTTSTGRSEGYSFNWSNTDGSVNISVSTDMYGNITSYSKYNQQWYSKNENFKIRENFKIEEPKKIADDAIRTFAPKLFSSDFDLLSPIPYDGIYPLSNPATYTFNYERMYNGVKVKDNYASVTVIYTNDSYEVQNLHIAWDYLSEFENLDGIISAEDAIKIYTEKYPLRLEYRKTHNGDYLLEYIHDKIHYIDAKESAEVTEDEKEAYPFLKAENTAADSTSGGGSSRLTPAEIKELGNLENLKSVDELTKILISIPEFAFSDENLSSYSYKQEDEYFTSISANNNEYSTHASLNAKNGEILSYYKYSRDYTGDKDKYSPEKADSFLKKYYSDEVNSSKKENDINSVRYTRLIHDIPYVNNNISASWNETSGSIDNFSRNWDSDVSKIPAPDNILSENDAYDTILKKYPITLQYIMVNDMFKPVYTVFNSGIRLDAFKGEFLNYSGVPEDDEKTEYTDIDGHWCKKIADTLADYGITTGNAQLSPDSQITQSEFLKLVYAGVLGRYLPTDLTAMYKRFENLNVLSGGEMNSTSPITRETAIRYLLRAMGICEVAEIKGIYICDFADSSDISEDMLGYCAIAKGFGLVNGSDGNLYPKKNITNAEALALIYNYLTR